MKCFPERALELLLHSQRRLFKDADSRALLSED